MMEDKNQIMRSIPQVEKILQTDEIRPFIPEIGRAAVTGIIRDALDGVRATADKGRAVNLDRIIETIALHCSMKKLQKLQRVINGTGVIIHTNLGRSPVGDDILGRLADNLAGYCNLEFDLVEQRRGGRGGLAEELICACTGAEDALVVNNNAASVFLILNEFARGREVIVSRGELVQIGGGFRLPDIMRQSGAILVEAGTTNVTTIDDYRGAVTGDTAMIFSCHRSNFTMEGFTGSPKLSDIAALKNESILFVRDLGSGNLANDSRLPGRFEPSVRSELDEGPDLICFSGDKILGASQAGIIAGKKELVSRLRRNPLMRMIRVDKFTYYILQETLLRYVNGGIEQIPFWNMLFQTRKTVSARISRFLRLVKNVAAGDIAKRVATRAAIGGGAMPGFDMESMGVRIDIPGLGAAEIYAAFASAEVPVVGAVIDGFYTLDFFTILDRDVPPAAETADFVITHARRRS